MSYIEEKQVEKSESRSFDEGMPDVAVLEHEVQAVSSDIEEAMVAARGMSPEEIDDAIHDMLAQHENDPNFPATVLDAARRYVHDPSVKADSAEFARLYQELTVEAALIKINSPYPEVRAAVSNKDDPTLPVSTVRAWVIGLVYVAAGAFINQFFEIRLPSIAIQSNVAQLLAYPAGKFLEKVLPAYSFHLFGNEISLNPGPFNLKEHMLITIMANVGFSIPYTHYVIFVQRLEIYFNQPWAANFGYQLLTSLSTNFIGYGLAGLTRRFLVYPSSAVWPQNLATITLNRAFHSGKNETANGWRITRMRYFLYCFAAMFVYFFFPNYIFEAMSLFNWMTWIAPTNVNLAAITGSVEGLGLNPIPTFDWNVLTANADPLINPFFTMINLLGGMLISVPVIVGLWYNNVWNTGYLPINDNHVFDNTGALYNVSRIVNSDALFDQVEYEKYSPAYLAAGNLCNYAFFFAVYAATVSHTILYHRHEIANGFRQLIARKSYQENHKDIHSKLMGEYKEVSELWYFAMLLVSIAVGAAGVSAFPTHTSGAVVLFGVFLAVIFCVPIGIITAITNVQITLNVLAEFLGGVWFTGNANAMNFFKTYGYVTTAHTITFAQDLKLAHYTKIPQRTVFVAQTVATFVSTVVCVGIINFQMTQIPNVCQKGQKNRFTCPNENTFFTASVLWGTLGPTRTFGKTGLYSNLLFCFLIGFFLPPIFYFAKKRYPKLGYVHLPVLLTGGLLWAPLNLTYLWPAIPVAFVFNVYIKRRFLPWWSKYNYLTTTAFACAIAICAVVQFFALQFPNVSLNWWGNTVSFAGCDAEGCARLAIPADPGFFGPGPGHFH